MTIDTSTLEHCFDGIIKAIVPKTSWVDWILIKALIKQESGFNPKAVSPAGARGLCQTMAMTREWLNDHSDGFDIYQSITDAYKFLAMMYDIYAKRGITSPDLDKFVLASYNAGPGNIDKAYQAATLSGGLDAQHWDYVASKLPEITGKYAQETIHYVNKVMAYYTQYKTQV